ncbi:hypothetical protein R50072_21240 [Simiduia litorea]|uniref:hypothetical protein n=1 Tax=Simiduia litorea TaxID=1435348 RepID=UPI0036F2EC7B
MLGFNALLRNVVSIVPLFVFGAAQAAADAAIDVGVDLGVRYQAQQYSDNNASLWSTTLSPYVAYEDWIVGVDVPFQRVEGVFNFRGSAQQARNCDLLSSGAQLPEKLEPFRDRLLARCTALTEENNTEEGVGDVNIYASFGKSFAHTSGYWLWTLGYDGDNADAERQLGSGTRDVYLDFVVIKDHDYFSLLFLVGYNYLVGGVNKDLYDSYSYIGAEISTQKDKPWLMGIGVDYQYDNVEPIVSARLFGQWQASESVVFKVQVKGYEHSVYYPSSSVDASLLFSF